MERRSKRPRRRGRRLLFLAVLAVLAGFYVHWGNTALQTAAFSPAFPDLPPGFDGCRVVVLGDLHSTWFGEKNETLLEAVRAQEPEYIFLVGDLLDAFQDVPDGYARETAAGLTAIAPTYYVTGNHEWALRDVPELKKALEAQGVTIMTCGTCLNYYGLTERLAVGSVSNMYTIAETLAGAGKVIRP